MLAYSNLEFPGSQAHINEITGTEIYLTKPVPMIKHVQLWIRYHPNCPDSAPPPVFLMDWPVSRHCLRRLLPALSHISRHRTVLCRLPPSPANMHCVYNMWHSCWAPGMAPLHDGVVIWDSSIGPTTGSGIYFDWLNSIYSTCQLLVYPYIYHTHVTLTL